MFEEPAKLALGLGTGVIFGFLLQKGQVAKFQVILGQLLLKDWTVVKIMVTAVAVGSVGVYYLVDQGMASLHIQPAAMGRIIPGALLFGLGLAIFGLCPGTSVAASGEGQRDAMFGVAGMLTGAAAYIALFDWLKPMFESAMDWGKVTLPQITETSHWLWVVGVAILAAIGLGAARLRQSMHHLPRDPIPGH